MIDVFLAGDGATELGGWSHEKAYRAERPEPGVLEALLRKVAPSGWTVLDAVAWRSIRKFQAGKHEPEVRNVLGAALAAKESGADLFVFSRDRDGDDGREGLVRDGIDTAVALFGLRIVGAVAVEAIEAWTLAVHGVRKVYERRWPKDVMRELGLPQDHESQVRLVENGALENVDSPLLKVWLEDARDVFALKIPEDAPIFLIGFMATGKTTIGGMVAKHLGLAFVDLDKKIEETVKKTIPEIFASEGEAAFRRYESETLRDVSRSKKVVVATGGGAAVHADNLKIMLDSGRVVTLSITADEAVRRAHGGKGRPLLEGHADPVGRAAELLAEREPFYSRAHLRVETVGRAPREVAQELLYWLRASTSTKGKP